MANTGPTFDPPKGFDPRGAKPGDTFECVAKAEIGKDGKYTLVALDGVPFKEEAETPKEDAAEPGFSDAMDNGENYPPQ